MNQEYSESSPFKTLSAFAEKSHRKLIFNEEQYPGSVRYGGATHKQTFYMEDKQNSEIYLAGFFDPKQFGENELWFGVFCSAQLPEFAQFTIRKKNILDKLNPFLRNKTLSSENRIFDSKTVITGNDSQLASKLLFSSELQQKILESFTLSPLLFFGANPFRIDFCPALKNQSIMGFYTFQKWILEEDFIEELFLNMQKIHKTSPVNY